MVAVVTLAVFATGCVDTFTQLRVEPVTVVSEPEGATIWIEEKGERRVLGAAPRQVEIARVRREKRFNHAHLAWPIGSGALMAAGGILFPITDGDDRSFAVGMVVVGLVFAATTAPGVLIGLLQDGTIVSDRPVPGTRLGASLLDYEDDVRALDNPNYADATFFVLRPTPQKQKTQEDSAEPASTPRRELPDHLRPEKYQPTPQ